MMEAPNFQSSMKHFSQAVFTVFLKWVFTVYKIVVQCVADNCSNNYINLFGQILARRKFGTIGAICLKSAN